jgi:hypothetical protein
VGPVALQIVLTSVIAVHAEDRWRLATDAGGEVRSATPRSSRTRARNRSQSATRQPSPWTLPLRGRPRRAGRRSLWLWCFSTDGSSTHPQGSDDYLALDVRRTFHDTSFGFHPVQLMGHFGFFDGDSRLPRPERRKRRPGGVAGMRYAFRSKAMGAPQWYIGESSGGSATGGPWIEEEREAVPTAVATYKTRIRPLVRSADLYHIFPRSDNRVRTTCTTPSSAVLHWIGALPKR